MKSNLNHFAIVLSGCFLLASWSLSASAAAPLTNLRITNDVRVYQSVKDGVVNIASTRIVNAAVGSGDEVFDRFFGPRFVREVPMQSLGSGFVIHAAGYIVTNEHVIDRATEVQVLFADGQKLSAQVLATDNAHDLAVLKVTPAKNKPLTAITLGSSDDLLIGEPVFAIGNPFGYSGSMTRGIISAVNRDLDFGQSGAPGSPPTGPEETGHVYKGLIQTDASINPGNSGGPLLNAYGQVIGINTAIRAQAQGIGFAIGVSHLRDLLPSFLNTEVLHRAVLGFTIGEKRSLTPPANVAATVYVKTVTLKSEAAKAGLQAGDQIVAVQGVPAVNVVDTLVAVANVQTGDTVSLRVTRAGTLKPIDIKIAVTAAPPPESERIAWERLGLAGETLTPAIAKAQNLPISTGILVSKVDKDSPAAATGLEKGDVIIQLGPYYVTSLEDIATLIKNAKPELQIRIAIIRKNSRESGTITIR